MLSASGPPQLLLQLTVQLSQACADGIQDTPKRARTPSQAHQPLHKTQKLLVFKLFLRQYVYCAEHGTFEALPAMPAQLPERIRQVLHHLHAINQGSACCCAHEQDTALMA